MQKDKNIMAKIVVMITLKRIFYLLRDDEI